jgi:hypothetical protein
MSRRDARASRGRLQRVGRHECAPEALEGHPLAELAMEPRDARDDEQLLASLGAEAVNLVELGADRPRGKTVIRLLVVLRAQDVTDERGEGLGVVSRDGTKHEPSIQLPRHGLSGDAAA